MLAEGVVQSGGGKASAAPSSAVPRKLRPPGEVEVFGALRALSLELPASRPRRARRSAWSDCSRGPAPSLHHATSEYYVSWIRLPSSVCFA